MRINKTFKIKLQELNSKQHFVLIPKEISRELKLKKGMILEIDMDDKKRVIIKKGEVKT